MHDLIREIQSIAQIGLRYSKDQYDLERYKRLREISFEVIQKLSAVDLKQVEKFFIPEIGYATPKVDLRTFGDKSDIKQLSKLVFRNSIWKQLNLGELNEQEAKQNYCRLMQLKIDQVDLLFYHIKSTQDLIEGSDYLLHRLSNANYNIFALTDNVKEIVIYLRNRYNFWHHFKGVVVSADVHCLKPNADIYLSLLNLYKIKADETVFIDDHLPNIEGGQRVGLIGLKFDNSIQCENDLVSLGLTF